MDTRVVINPISIKRYPYIGVKLYLPEENICSPWGIRDYLAETLRRAYRGEPMTVEEEIQKALEWSESWRCIMWGKRAPLYLRKDYVFAVKVPYFISYRIRDLANYNKISKNMIIQFLLVRGFKSLAVDLNKDPFEVKIEVTPPQKFIEYIHYKIILYDWHDNWIKLKKKYKPVFGRCYERPLVFRAPFGICKRIFDLCKYNGLNQSEVVRFLLDKGLRSLGVDLNKKPFEIDIYSVPEL